MRHWLPTRNPSRSPHWSSLRAVFFPIFKVAQTSFKVSMSGMLFSIDLLLFGLFKTLLEQKSCHISTVARSIYSFNSLHLRFLSSSSTDTSSIFFFASSLSVLTRADRAFTCDCKFSSTPESSSLDTGSEYLKFSPSFSSGFLNSASEQKSTIYLLSY